MKSKPCDHEWAVFSSAVDDKAILVQCVECLAIGTVGDPTEDEWERAYHSPSRPYRWDDDGRVTVRFPDIGVPYVIRSVEGAPTCDCRPYERELDYLRCPGEILKEPAPLTPEEMADLTTLANAVANSDVCGGVLAEFLRSFQSDTGQEPCGASKRIAGQLEALSERGMHFPPQVVADVLRKYAALG